MKIITAELNSDAMAAFSALYNAVEDLRALEEERKGTKRKLEAVFETFRTSKQLVEAWPEVTPFVTAAAGIASGPCLLPVVIDGYNKEFNLPV